MSTRTITGTVLDSAGNAATGTVRFVLERGTWSAAEHAIPDETTATLTAGAFSITVYTPARYKVYLPTGYHFSVNIPAGSATTIEALRLASEDLPDLSTVLDDFLEALEINGLEYGAGQTPRWDGDSWEPADYYTEAESDALYAALAHTHDDRYYTEAESDALIAGFITQAAGDARYGQLGAANTWALAQTFTGQVLASAGLVGTPSYSFALDPNTGIYNSGVDTLALAAGGTLAMSMNATTVTSPLTFNQNGTFNANSFFNISISDAVTNGTSVVGTLRHSTSGTAANGFGLRWDWQLESSTGALTGAGNQSVYWVDATHATRTSGFRVSAVYNTANYDAFQISRTGVADSTSLWLFDETAASLKQVTRGAADSGGAGFRLLRVAN
jgi:hypothetical protein